MSVGGGVSKAVDRAELHGCEALQIFTKNANQWRSKPLDGDEIKRFRRRLDAAGIVPAVSHASYLINMATTDPALRALSIDSLVDELDRAHALGLLGVVIHPALLGPVFVSTRVTLLPRATTSSPRRALRRRLPTSIGSSALTVCGCFMPMTRSGRAGAASIGMNISEKAAWASTPFGGYCTIGGLRAVLIETAKTS